MQQFMVKWEARLITADKDRVIPQLDDVMGHLVECDDVIDPGIDYNSELGTVAFEVAVDSPDPMDAVAKATSLVRAAVHAAELGTPQWPDAQSLAQALRFEQGPSFEERVDA